MARAGHCTADVRLSQRADTTKIDDSTSPWLPISPSIPSISTSTLVSTPLSAACGRVFCANAPSGDSSIHLLVDEKRTAADTTRPAVVRSILIDGGWTKVIDSRVQGKLTGILGEIGQMYQWPAANGYDNNQPAFDAIVISTLGSKLASCCSREPLLLAGLAANDSL